MPNRPVYRHHGASVAPPLYQLPLHAMQRSRVAADLQLARPHTASHAIDRLSSQRRTCRPAEPTRRDHRQSTAVRHSGNALAKAFAIGMIASFSAAAVARPYEGPAGHFRRPLIPTAPPPDPDDRVAPRAYDDVIVQPAPREWVRTSYTQDDVLRALTHFDRPFRSVIDLADDIHTIIHGQPLNPDTRARLRASMEGIDALTQLVPGVAQTRLGGRIAQAMLDTRDGQAPNADELADIVMQTNVRGLESGEPVSTHDMGWPAQAQPPSAIDIWSNSPREPDLTPRVSPGDDPGSMGLDAADAADDADDAGDDAADASPAVAGDPVSVMPFDVPWTPLAEIEGERIYLDGYAHSSPTGPLTPMRDAGLYTSAGENWLRSRDGYYRLRPSPDRTHWLARRPGIGAGGAEVPLRPRIDGSGWIAHAPLQLRGGGGVLGKSARTGIRSPDSGYRSVERNTPIATGSHRIDDSRLSHVSSDADSVFGYALDMTLVKTAALRKAFTEAFDDVADMNLQRSNRDDRRMTRVQNTLAGRGHMNDLPAESRIANVRQYLARRMSHIDRNTPLRTQQQKIARITAEFFRDNPGGEAYCQENAEALMGAMLDSGVPAEHLAVITIQKPTGPGRGHAMVLYSDTDTLFDALVRTTPKIPRQVSREGMSLDQFVHAIMPIRDRVMLFDTWAMLKQLTFYRAMNFAEVYNTLKPTLALADLVQPGVSYRVTLARQTMRSPTTAR